MANAVPFPKQNIVAKKIENGIQKAHRVFRPTSKCILLLNESVVVGCEQRLAHVTQFWMVFLRGKAVEYIVGQAVDGQKYERFEGCGLESRGRITPKLNNNLKHT